MGNLGGLVGATWVDPINEMLGIAQVLRYCAIASFMGFVLTTICIDGKPEICPSWRRMLRGCRRRGPEPGPTMGGATLDEKGLSLSRDDGVAYAHPDARGNRSDSGGGANADEAGSSKADSGSRGGGRSGGQGGRRRKSVRWDDQDHEPDPDHHVDHHYNHVYNEYHAHPGGLGLMSRNEQENLEFGVAQQDYYGEYSDEEDYDHGRTPEAVAFFSSGQGKDPGETRSLLSQPGHNDGHSHGPDQNRARPLWR